MFSVDRAGQNVRASFAGTAGKAKLQSPVYRRSEALRAYLADGLPAPRPPPGPDIRRFSAVGVRDFSAVTADSTS